MKIQYLTDQYGFEGLKERWNELLARSASNNIFLTWEWVHTWWEVYSESKTQLLITVEENGRLLGIAPLYVTRARYFGIRALNHVEFMCSVGPCSEYLDFIIEKGHERDVVYAIMDKIFSDEMLQWDVMNLMSINANSVNLIWFIKYAQEKLHYYETFGKRESAYIMLPETTEKYYKKLSGNERYRLRRYRKTLVNDYSVSFNLVTSEEELENSLNVFINLHQKRWKGKGGEGSFCDNRKEYIQFHRKVATLLLQNKWLYLAFLKVNNESVASQYNFIYGNKISYFQAGFDPDWAKYHVGSILQSFVIEDIISKKISEYDFLRGTEEYKYRWTKTTRASLDMSIWRSGFIRKEVTTEKIIRNTVGCLMPKTFAKNIYNWLFVRDK